MGLEFFKNIQRIDIHRLLGKTEEIYVTNIVSLATKRLSAPQLPIPFKSQIPYWNNPVSWTTRPLPRVYTLAFRQCIPGAAQQSVVIASSSVLWLMTETAVFPVVQGVVELKASFFAGSGVGLSSSKKLKKSPLHPAIVSSQNAMAEVANRSDTDSSSKVLNSIGSPKIARQSEKFEIGLDEELSGCWLASDVGFSAESEIRSEPIDGFTAGPPNPLAISGTCPTGASSSNSGVPSSVHKTALNASDCEIAYYGCNRFYLSLESYDLYWTEHQQFHGIFSHWKELHTRSHDWMMVLGWMDGVCWNKNYSSPNIVAKMMTAHPSSPSQCNH
uniref:Uncharacterized protein n=1 Tax=Solanum lycopersicum TaxID=4081 RepID=A0A3Q7EYG8_SOLLC